MEFWRRRGAILNLGQGCRARTAPSRHLILAKAEVVAALAHDSPEP